MNNHVAFGSFNLKISRLADLADRFGHQLCPSAIHSGSDSPINHFSLSGMVFFVAHLAGRTHNFATLDMAEHNKTKL